jgi:hypothetical protein
MTVESIVTAPFRLAFPEIFAPKAGVEGGKEKYSITMLFPKDGTSLLPAITGDGLLELRKLALEAVKEKWGADKSKWPANLKSLDFKTAISPSGKDGWPIRDGDAVEWDGFGGNFFARASSQYKPGLVDAKLQAILDKETVFGGLICRAQINAFAYDNAGNKGVSFGVNNLQILKDDGTCFGGKQNPAEVFDAFGEAGGSTAIDEAPW